MASLLCSKRCQSRRSYLPDGVCDECGPTVAPQFAFGAAFVICPFLAELLWSQRGLEFLEVESGDLCYLFSAQLFSVLCSSGVLGIGIYVDTCSPRSMFAPPANVFACVTWFPHRAVLQPIRIVKDYRREHLSDALLHRRGQARVISLYC